MIINDFNSRNGVDSDLVAVVPQLLCVPVIRVLVRQKECPSDRTSIAIRSILHKDLLIDLPVFVVDGVIEGQDHHLRCLVDSEVTRDASRVHGAEAVRKSAVGQVTASRSIWILLWITIRFIGTIRTVSLSVTELVTIQALAVSTCQLTLGTNG